MTVSNALPYSLITTTIKNNIVSWHDMRRRPSLYLHIPWRRLRGILGKIYSQTNQCQKSQLYVRQPLMTLNEKVAGNTDDHHVNYLDQ